MSNPEQPAGEEQGDSNRGFNEHLKENKAAGEVFKSISPFSKGALVRAGWI